jgi:hypothetical protein
LPPTDQKDQQYLRTSGAPIVGGPTRTKALHRPLKKDETEINANTGVFKGKVHVVHVKTDTAETWASPEPFEFELTLDDGRIVKVRATYTKSLSDSNGQKTSAEVLSLADFPVVMLWMHTKTTSTSLSSEVTQVLKSIQ